MNIKPLLIFEKYNAANIASAFIVLLLGGMFALASYVIIVGDCEEAEEKRKSKK